MTEQAKAPAKPYGDVKYADPGYRDNKKRYPIDTPAHVRSAWAYINQSGNAKLYTPGQREKIKARIAAAAKRFGINLAAEEAAQHERLRRNDGRVDAIGPKSTARDPFKRSDGEADTPALGPTPGGVTPKQAEDRTIAENAQTPQAKGPHPFMEAQFNDDAGNPRCLLCGQGMATHKVFEPEIPIAAAENSGVRATLTERPATPVLAEGTSIEPPDTAKAFLTEVNGRTLITAPANVFTTEAEKALHANEHFLWMQGRFVGAEKANRNGAFWSTEDLELGELTVRHGPLNWLHEARHVIGTIADTRMVKRDEQLAMDLDQPHISALSAIWKWIYPDEAWVIEQASDAGKLWYSMECVSKEVACVGENGCGAKASYGDYLQGKGATCAHMTERSATRHFANPTFLGGAVIVPPVRPGWAEADASVLRQAASLAERSFDQAGQPDVAASEWEQLMAQVLRFAGI